MSSGYDPFDPEQVDDHAAALERLRRESPVSQPHAGFFYLARHRDVLDVCRSPEIFGQGRHIPPNRDTRSVEQLNLGETDPPTHSRVRRVLAALLTPAKVRSMDALVRGASAMLVDRFAPSGAADIIADLASPLPVAVIGSLSGMPAQYHRRFAAYSDAFMMRTDPDPFKCEAACRVVESFDAIARQIIRERQASHERPDDILTGLIEALDEQGRPLSEDKILTHMTKDVIVGGTETTKHLIGNLFFNLCTTPGAYERVRQNRSLVGAAVEETLRISGPVQIMFRVPKVDVEIQGCSIPAGSTIGLGYASANHDEAAFVTPDHFDLERDSRAPHFGFGHGIHVCVGAGLARLEATCALNAVLDRAARMRLAPGFKYRRVRSFVMRGPESVDVRFDPILS